MKWHSLFLVFLICPIALSTCEQPPSTPLVIHQSQIPNKRSALEISKLSKDVTIQIDGRKPGSGVLITQYGETYYVLTSKDVVKKPDQYEIVTPDGERYQVNYRKIKKIPGVNLAVVPFTSSRNYLLVELGDSKGLRQEMAIYISGFNASGTAIEQSRLQFSPGKLTKTLSKKKLKNGYYLEYNNRTLKGMQGGPILDENGYLIGIHGGENLGISSEIFIQQASKAGIDLSLSITHNISSSELALTEIWKVQFGSPTMDVSTGMTVDSSGNVYIMGASRAQVWNNWLAKYDKSGSLIWKKYLEDLDNELTDAISRGIAVDSFGNVYLIRDPAKVVKYDSNGSLIWKKQFGISINDQSRAIIVDSHDNIYLIGSMANPSAEETDLEIAKYNSLGSLIWKTSPIKGGSYIAVDQASNVYVTGATNDFLDEGGNVDAWLSKYDNNGFLVWKKQLGIAVSDSLSHGISVDLAGNIYITGETDGTLASLNSGNRDVWIAKYNSRGFLVWKKQWGTIYDDHVRSIAVAQAGNIYLSGFEDQLTIEASDAAWDAWIVKYDSNGVPIWKKTIRTSKTDSSESLIVDNEDNIYIAGSTTGSLAGVNLGDWDVWLIKYSQNSKIGG
ncbi:MAG: SBBP repeat-containing protein [Xenococcus sp. (in: cyanobacteria)]